MKIFKKNQVIIYVIALMLMTAGYLNYTTNNEKDSSLDSTSFLEEFKDNLQLNGSYKYVDNLIIFAYNKYNSIVAIDTSGPKIQYYYLVMQDDNNIVTYQSYNSITELPINKHS